MGPLSLEMAWKARKATVVAVLLVLASMGLAGCTSSQQVAQIAANEAGCADASGVDNNPGSFNYGGATSCKTGTETFAWENPAPRAQIQHGSAIQQGEIEVTLTDGADRTVYQGTSGPGAEGRQENSEWGVPANPASGSWTVELEFRNVTGTLGLEITSTE